MPDTSIALPDGFIEDTILLLRGKRVILDHDLARLYGVTTRALNQDVKRNPDRFPEEFMFQLTDAETEECQHLKRSRSQIVILNKGRGTNIKYHCKTGSLPAQRPVTPLTIPSTIPYPKEL